MALKQLKVILLLIFSFQFIFYSSINASAESKNRYYYEKQGTAIWEVPVKEKVIAITFDDGPNDEYTPEVLDLLKKYNAKATFFLVGERVAKFPEVVMREIKEGHEVANHTYTHARLQYLTDEQIRDQLHKTHDAIIAATHVEPVLFRPPFGYYSERSINTVHDLGYLTVMWSWHQDTFDWQNPGVYKIVSNVLKDTRKGDIVLFHDHGGDRSQTVDALKQILPALQKQGYQFVTVSQLLQLKAGVKLPNF
ncbi:polysaccharide deacetylase family protein [Bacillus sp. AFS029533]|uniref:Chitooligosaccharide deacetylase n=1 Tax=Gottfriedia luciferensis TaxID=178774 RepID=A0ABX2ZV05_9BACI|nr:chitooligosaccharide deacetylase [Gottfriedia luciferensis]PGZ93560.1 polysaccharide deacetylase family protein [Bacillus sp. AFS029533]SFC18975.1 polysaccharide deacetylase family sporulation protein PdaB [Bacillus sp. UNCCL81]